MFKATMKDSSIGSLSLLFFLATLKRDDGTVKTFIGFDHCVPDAQFEKSPTQVKLTFNERLGADGEQSG